MHAFVQIVKAAVFRAGEQVPIQGALRLGFTVERQEVDVVLFIQFDFVEPSGAQVLPPFPASLCFPIPLSGDLGAQQGVNRAAIANTFLQLAV